MTKRLAPGDAAPAIEAKTAGGGAWRLADLYAAYGCETSLFYGARIAEHIPFEVVDSFLAEGASYGDAR